MNTGLRPSARIEAATLVVNLFFLICFNTLKDGSLAAIIDFPPNVKMHYSHVLIITAFLIFGCCPPRKTLANTTRPQTTPRTTRRPGASRDLAALIKDLRAHAATIKLSNETVAQSFFTARGRIIYINGESIWIFSYANRTTLDRDAHKISSDGMTIGNTKPSWLGTPHFFRRPRMIILYLGDEPRILDVLRGAVGTQFAGG